MNVNSAHTTSWRTAKRLLGLWHVLTAPLYWLYERSLLRAVHAGGRMPKHLGMILDGNRRFARSLGLAPEQGHDIGAAKAREVLEWCLELGIDHITMWVFSSDNQGRAEHEVSHLFDLFEEQARKMAQDPKLHKHKVHVRVIGDISGFPERVQQALQHLEQVTAHYQAMQLNIAIGYGGREEITHAVRTMLRSKASSASSLEALVEAISAEEIGKHLYTAGMPDPDFVIRTSGEVRLSGFLLWQTAYSEFYFCDVFWPSFRKVDLLRALRNFQARERRFGR